MPVTKLELKNFTVFEKLELEFSEGINLLIGENGTGKTHIMKAIYAACAVHKNPKDFAEKLVSVFLPRERRLGRLVKRAVGRHKAEAAVFYRPPEPSLFEENTLSIGFSNLVKKSSSSKISIKGMTSWSTSKIRSIYIPVKEMLANAPGFGSLYHDRELHFEEVYPDIVQKALIPSLRRAAPAKLLSISKDLEKILQGKVATEKELFLLRGKQNGRRGNLEFTLLSEGLRKLGLLWVLLQNGKLSEKAILFWDEPETNLNPALFEPIVQALIELQRTGIQIFLATHSYLIAKNFDLLVKKDDHIKYHHLYAECNKMQCQTYSHYSEIPPTGISKAYDIIYKKTIDAATNGKQS